MRLWHEALIPYLPRQQLLGQHRECCALRGNGWGKPHATVNYVFKHSMMYLIVYHKKVIKEMRRRGYNVDASWDSLIYRGKNCKPAWWYEDECAFASHLWCKHPIYPEHDSAYLAECLNNLRNKGIILEGFDYERVGL